MAKSKDIESVSAEFAAFRKEFGARLTAAERTAAAAVESNAALQRQVEQLTAHIQELSEPTTSVRIFDFDPATILEALLEQKLELGKRFSFTEPRKGSLAEGVIEYLGKIGKIIDPSSIFGKMKFTAHRDGADEFSIDSVHKADVFYIFDARRIDAAIVKAASKNGVLDNGLYQALVFATMQIAENHITKFLEAARVNKARSVHAIALNIPGARADRVLSQERMMVDAAHMLRRFAQYDSVIYAHLHAAQSISAIDGKPIYEIAGHEIYPGYFWANNQDGLQSVAEMQKLLRDVTLVSPDISGMKGAILTGRQIRRMGAELLAQKLGTPSEQDIQDVLVQLPIIEIAGVNKGRNDVNVPTSGDITFVPEIRDSTDVASVDLNQTHHKDHPFKGKRRLILLDDMADSGGSLVKAAEICHSLVKKTRGPKPSIEAYTTHVVGNADLLNKIISSPISNFAFTDSQGLSPDMLNIISDPKHAGLFTCIPLNEVVGNIMLHALTPSEANLRLNIPGRGAGFRIGGYNARTIYQHHVKI